MSVSCDKCKDQGTEENPIFYIEAYLKGVPILESMRTPELLDKPEMNPWAAQATPYTLHLHKTCAEQLFNTISEAADKFIKPKEKPGGKKTNKAKKP